MDCIGPIRRYVLCGWRSRGCFAGRQIIFLATGYTLTNESRYCKINHGTVKSIKERGHRTNMSKHYGLTASGEEANVQRGDMPRFYPEDLIPNTENYRFGSSDSDPAVIAAREEEIEEMVTSLINDGQQQPIVIRPIPGKRFQVHAGDTRHRAALRINERKAWPHSEDGLMRLECIVQACDAKSAFGNSITENLHRNNLTVIDTANGVMMATEKYKFTDAEILQKFNQLKPNGQPKDPAWLPNMRRLGVLPVERKRQIHLGHMAASVGYLLAEIPEAQHASILAEAAGQTGIVLSPPAGAYHEAITAGLEGVSIETEHAEEAHGDTCGPDCPEHCDLAPDTRTLDYSESQSPPVKSSGQPKPKRKKAATKVVTARAVATVAKKRGLLKHKKVSHTVAGMREFWSPMVTERPGSLVSRLAEASIAWIDTADDASFWAALLPILKGAK